MKTSKLNASGAEVSKNILPGSQPEKKREIVSKGPFTEDDEDLDLSLDDDLEPLENLDIEEDDDY